MASPPNQPDAQRGGPGLLSSSFWAAAAEKLAGHDYYVAHRGQILQNAAAYRAANREQRARKARAYRRQVAVGSRHVRERTQSGNRYIFGSYR